MVHVRMYTFVDIYTYTPFFYLSLLFLFFLSHTIYPEKKPPFYPVNPSIDMSVYLLYTCVIHVHMNFRVYTCIIFDPFLHFNFLNFHVLKIKMKQKKKIYFKFFERYNSIFIQKL